MRGVLLLVGVVATAAACVQDIVVNNALAQAVGLLGKTINSLSEVSMGSPKFFLIRRQKGPTQSQTIARTAPKNCLNNSRGLSGHCPIKQGVLRQIVPESSRTLGKIFVTQFLVVAFLAPISGRYYCLPSEQLPSPLK